MITIILSGVKFYLWSKETLILSFHIELYFVGLLFTSYKQFFIFVTEGDKTQKREDIKTPLAVGGIKIIYCPNFQLFYKMSLECIISWRKCAPPPTPPTHTHSHELKWGGQKVLIVQTFELRTLKFGLYYPLMIYIVLYNKCPLSYLVQ